MTIESKIFDERKLEHRKLANLQRKLADEEAALKVAQDSPAYNAYVGDLRFKFSEMVNKTPNGAEIAQELTEARVQSVKKER